MALSCSRSRSCKWKGVTAGGIDHLWQSPPWTPERASTETSAYMPPFQVAKASEDESCPTACHADRAECFEGSTGFLELLLTSRGVHPGPSAAQHPPRQAQNSALLPATALYYLPQRNTWPCVYSKGRVPGVSSLIPFCREFQKT